MSLHVESRTCTAINRVVYTFVLLEGAASMCRACFFNVLRFQESNSGEDLPAYVDCPCCVLDVYEETSAHDEDGPRCEGTEEFRVDVWVRLHTTRDTLSTLDNIASANKICRGCSP